MHSRIAILLTSCTLALASSMHQPQHASSLRHVARSEAEAKTTAYYKEYKPEHQYGGYKKQHNGYMRSLNSQRLHRRSDPSSGTTTDVPLLARSLVLSRGDTMTEHQRRDTAVPQKSRRRKGYKRAQVQPRSTGPFAQASASENESTSPTLTPTQTGETPVEVKASPISGSTEQIPTRSRAQQGYGYGYGRMGYGYRGW